MIIAVDHSSVCDVREKSHVACGSVELKCFCQKLYESTALLSIVTSLYLNLVLSATNARKKCHFNLNKSKLLLDSINCWLFSREDQNPVIKRNPLSSFSSKFFFLNFFSCLAKTFWWYKFYDFSMNFNDVNKNNSLYFQSLHFRRRRKQNFPLFNGSQKELLVNTLYNPLNVEKFPTLRVSRVVMALVFAKARELFTASFYFRSMNLFHLLPSRGGLMALCKQLKISKKRNKSFQ